MANSTMEKFGYPASLVREYDHWVVLVRPAQATLGSLVLAARSEATAYGDLPAEAFAEQSEIIPAIEKALQSLCRYERVNYLMLMMVDPHVHFHVIPRYSGGRNWDGLEFPDAGWPGPPALKSAVELSGTQIEKLRDIISQAFE